MEQWVGDYDYRLPQRGEIRKGVIVTIEPQEIVVDIGVKRDGIVPLQDLQMLGEEEVAKLNVGEPVTVCVLKPEDAQGNMIVSINIARKQKDWVKAEEMQETGEIFQADVSDFNKGGLLVPFGHLRAFIPASQLSDLPRGLNQATKMARLKEYVGQTLPLKVIEVDRRRRRLILSERAARRRWREQQKEELLDSLAEGEVRHGVVSGLADFGAFVDLGGADGLIHVSELSWDRVTHPREVLEPGQEVDVFVLRLDRERRRIGLSLKRLQPDPWSLADERYEIDQLIKSVITNVVDFGAFARLEPGVEGLVHVSEMAEGEIGHPSNVLEAGEEVLVRIISIDSQRKRIGLSLRQVPRLEEVKAAEDAEVPSSQEVTEEPTVDQTLDLEEIPEEPTVVQALGVEETLEEPTVDQASDLEEIPEEPTVVQALRMEETSEEPTVDQGSDLEEIPEEPTVVLALGVEEIPEEPTVDQASDLGEIPEEPAVVQALGAEETLEGPTVDQASDLEEIPEEPAVVQALGVEETLEGPTVDQASDLEEIPEEPAAVQALGVEETLEEPILDSTPDPEMEEDQ
jgi:small subunit ribosomal protein S1